MHSNPWCILFIQQPMLLQGWLLYTELIQFSVQLHFSVSLWVILHDQLLIVVSKINLSLGSISTLLAWKWAPTWLKLIICPTFIIKSFFLIKPLKNSLSFGKIKFLIKDTEKTKKMKNWKNLGGLRHVHMTRPWCLACLSTLHGNRSRALGMAYPMFQRT